MDKGGVGSTKEQWRLPVLCPRESHPDPCHSSPHLKASQFSSSPCVPAAPQAPIPALEPRASQFVRDRVCARLLRGMPRIPAALCLTNLQSLPIFTARCYRDSFSLHWCLGLRSQVWGWDPLLLKGDLPIRDLSNHKGPAYSISPPLL